MNNSIFAAAVVIIFLVSLLYSQDKLDGSSNLRIVYDHDVNKTFVRNVFDNISDKDLNGINQIYFSSTPDENRSGVYQYTFKSTSYDKSKINSLVSTRIIIYNDSYRSPEYLLCVLWHEIGHHREITTKRLNNLSESYADDYAYAHGCVPGTIYDERLDQPRNLSYWKTTN